jgi:hypothetical protein
MLHPEYRQAWFGLLVAVSVLLNYLRFLAILLGEADFPK